MPNTSQRKKLLTDEKVQRDFNFDHPGRSLPPVLPFVATSTVI
jgi:hypothetical protein